MYTGYFTGYLIDKGSRCSGAFGKFPIFEKRVTRKRPCIMKITGRRAKRTKITASQVWCIQNTFDCYVFKFSLESFCALSVFDDLLSTFDPGIFVLLSLYLTSILLFSKWPTRASRPLDEDWL